MLQNRTRKLVEDHLSATAKASVEAEADKCPAVSAADRVHLLLGTTGCPIAAAVPTAIAVAIPAVVAAVAAMLHRLLLLLTARHHTVVCSQHWCQQLTLHVTLSVGVQRGCIKLIWQIALRSTSAHK